MDRIVVNRSATLTRTFAFTPTSPPTVTLTRLSTGAAVTASSMSGTGATWTYTIPASSNTLLDTYTETITAESGGEPQLFTEAIEVAGGVFFSVTQARALPPLNDATGYPTTDILQTRTAAEQAIERECEVAFVSRYARDTVSGTGTRELLLRPLVRAVRSVTADGVAWSASDLQALTYQPDGTVIADRAWCGNIVVGYEHGYQEPPAEIQRAALILTKMWLVGRRNPIDDRAITFANAEGGTYSLAVPGRGGSHFGHPDIDAAIDRHALQLRVA